MDTLHLSSFSLRYAYEPFFADHFDDFFDGMQHNTDEYGRYPTL